MKKKLPSCEQTRSTRRQVSTCPNAGRTCFCDYVELANERAKEEHTNVGTEDVNNQGMSEINERIGWMGHDHDDWDIMRHGH